MIAGARILRAVFKKYVFGLKLLLPWPDHASSKTADGVEVLERVGLQESSLAFLDSLVGWLEVCLKQDNV